MVSGTLDAVQTFSLKPRAARHVFSKPDNAGKVVS